MSATRSHASCSLRRRRWHAREARRRTECDVGRGAGASRRRRVQPRTTASRLGDELHVRFTYQPEMNEQLPVRPDGRISLATTGELTCVGMTPPELERIDRARSPRRGYASPRSSSIVTKIAEQRVYIGGEVGKPGYVALRPA